MTTTIRWRITGRPDDGVDVYQLVVDKGQVKTVKGESGDPKLTVTMDAVEFLKLASGNLDPMQAYFKGRIELTGDIMVAAKLAQLFKMPGRRQRCDDGGESVATRTTTIRPRTARRRRSRPALELSHRAYPRSDGPVRPRGGDRTALRRQALR